MTSINFHALTPTQFENLAYDLLTWRGLRNANWRTPGADGGRDIEGHFDIRDLSGTYQTQKWYVDCKRYAKSIDWPTVYEKLSFATNHNADYLLIVCTPTVSPQCRTEINTWNSKRTTTFIRTWEPHYLEQLLIEHPEVAIKHGFRKPYLLDAPGFVEIAFEASKCADAAYSRAAFNDDSNIPELELASALSNFLAIQMQQPRTTVATQSYRAFQKATDGYDWLTVTPSSTPDHVDLDGAALRAVLCILRLISNEEISLISGASPRECILQSKSQAKIKLPPGMESTLKALCLFSSIEYQIADTHLLLRGQL